MPMSEKPRNSINFTTITILAILILLPVMWVVFLKKGRHYSQKLPILFERYANDKGDTIYHTIDDFIFTNQMGKKVTLDSLHGKILLVNFFFAQCPTVCPEMNKNMQYIYREFLKDEDVVFLSHTVDPENDVPEALYEYSRRFGAQAPKWHFLTGEKKWLYDMAEFSYRIPGSEDAQHAGFFHSQQIVLVDKERRVRGIFDGLKGMRKDGNPHIIDAVRALMYEYNHPQSISQQ
jgi:protein SCO1